MFLCLTMWAATTGCRLLGMDVLILRSTDAEKCRGWLELDYDWVSDEGVTFKYRLLPEEEHWQHVVTWKYDLIGAEAHLVGGEARLIWDKQDVGLGRQGIEAILSHLREVPTGTSVLLNPSYDTEYDISRPLGFWPLFAVYFDELEGKYVDYRSEFMRIAKERQLTFVCTEFGPLR